jgi:hypothetical protein
LRGIVRELPGRAVKPVTVGLRKWDFFLVRGTTAGRLTRWHTSCNERAVVDNMTAATSV